MTTYRRRILSIIRLASSLTVLSVLIAITGTAAAQEDVSFPLSEVGTLADSLVGGASGLSLDKMGVLYAGTFDDRVYRIGRDGHADVFATGQYGATGNVVGPLGNLFQLSFFGGYVTRIDRLGNQRILATGLETPMGITFGEGNLYVANCGSSAITRVTLDGKVSILSQGPPLNCPNGITYASDGNLYVVNFSDEHLLEVTLDGGVSVLATLPHAQNVITSARGHLYVASGSGREVHRVSLTTGEITHIAGSGGKGSTDGNALDATFSWPNGIAVEPARIFINDLQPRNEAGGVRQPLRTGVIRVVTLPSVTEFLIGVWDSEGEEAMINQFRKFKSDPAKSALLDEAEVNGWGLDTLPILPAAGLRILQLNAESYPGSWRVYDALGDAYRAVGQPEDAVLAFRRSLEINPENTHAAEMIERLAKR